MKKLLLLAVVMLNLIMFTACTQSKKEETNMINFDSGTFFDKNWKNDTVGNYDKEAVPDKDTAVEIAKAIFNGMKKGKDEQKYVPQSVFYDEQDEIWIVSFSESSTSSVVTVGGDCNIAIQKSDGKVLRIWYGE